jgi:hypothetical protein
MNETAKTLKITQLDEQIRSGNPLTVEALANHLNVDRKKATIIAKAFGLAPECGRYSWLRIWRAIHGIEGARLAKHLDEMKAQYPDSVILDKVKDLEAALRTQLIDFDAMANCRGLVTNTLSRALREGRQSLPFQTINLSKRARHYRPLEVTLWVQEGIHLNPPKPPSWAAAKSNGSTPKNETSASNPRNANGPVDTVKKDVFGAFAGNTRNHAA